MVKVLSKTVKLSMAGGYIIAPYDEKGTPGRHECGTTWGGISNAPGDFLLPGSGPIRRY